MKRLLDDVPGIARVHMDTWRTAYVDIVPAEYLAGLSYDAAESRWRENLSSQGDGRLLSSQRQMARLSDLPAAGRNAMAFPAMTANSTASTCWPHTNARASAAH